MPKFPFTNYHELNLDWILKKVDALFNASEENARTIRTYDTRLTAAEQTATSAGTAATAAQQLADAASANANSALSVAGTANTKADSALTAATNAADAVAGALTTAQEAQQTAAAAVATANDAAATASGLESLANTANQNATAALETAQTADQKAVAAQSAAATADQKAIAAQTAATTNAGNISTLQSDVSNLNRQLSDIEESINSALELVEPTNIVNKNALVTGNTLHPDTGKLLPNDTYCVLGFLAVKPNTTYYSYTGQEFTTRNVEAFFYESADENTFISHATNGVSFTTPSNCHYVRFPFSNAVWNAHGAYLHITPNQYESYTEYFTPYYKVPIDTAMQAVVNGHTKDICGEIVPVWEWGTINNTALPFTYTDSHSRVRMSASNAIWLTAGSKVGFTDYSGVRYFVAGVDKYGNNASTSWMTTDYIIQVDGYYQFVLTTMPEAVISFMTTLTEKFFVIESESLINVSEARNENLLSIAHQGMSATSQYYGNSRLSSYINAKKHYFDYGETDIVFSSDNVPMCCHDLTFTNTNDGTTVITIADHTASELKTYGYFGETIATLDEVLATCKRIGLGLVLDKLSRITTDAQWTTVFNIVQKYQMQDRVIFGIDGETQGTKVLDWYSEAKVQFIAESIDNTALAIISNLRTWYSRKNGIDINVNYSNVSDIATAYSSLPAGVKLYLWTVDRASDFITYMPYCAGITSNKISANKLLI